MTLDQSRKQTRETGSVIIPVLQNANSSKNECGGKKTSLSGGCSIAGRLVVLCVTEERQYNVVVWLEPRQGVGGPGKS